MWSRAVAAQEHGDVVRLEDGVVRIAREAAGRQQHGLAGATIERQVRASPAPATSLGEVRQPPRDRDAEPGGSAGTRASSVCERLLELVLRSAQVVDVDRRGDDLAVQRRHEHLDALALRRSRRSKTCCSGGQSAGRDGRAPARRAEPVDELVDAGAAERGGRRAPEEATPREAHQLWGRTSTRPAQHSVEVLHDLAWTCRTA